MVMGEVSLCRIEKLPPAVSRELRPALAKGDPAVLSGDRVRHELVVRPLAWTANLVERRCSARGPRPPVGHAPESCHWRVGKPFPQRFHAATTPGPSPAAGSGQSWALTSAVPSLSARSLAKATGRGRYFMPQSGAGTRRSAGTDRKSTRLNSSHRR